MIVDYIRRYLEQPGKVPDPSILADAVKRFQRRTEQAMSERVVKSGGYGANRATKCARANGYYHMGVEGEPMTADTLIKMRMGDAAELEVLTTAQLAFIGTPHSVGLNNEFVEVPIGPGEPIEAKAKIKGFIDGLLNFNWSYHADKFGEGPPEWLKTPDEDLLLEIKCMASYPFDIFTREGPDDTWGYLGQISTYQRAVKVRRYIMVALDREKGRMAEYVGTYGRQYTTKADSIYGAVMEAKALGKVPDIPPENAPQMKDGQSTLCVVCAYCSYKGRCWDEAGFELSTQFVKGRSGPRPVFTVARRNGR